MEMKSYLPNKSKVNTETYNFMYVPEVLKSYDAPKNAWLGVSVENKKHGVPRIDKLRRVKAHIRFLSIEPLLEDLGDIDLTNIQWVIVGGESGPKARPMKPEWVERIKQQCDNHKTSFFF